MARWLGLIDTFPMMVAAMVAMNQPFTIWLMRSFFMDVPVELDEAAMIDGCNRWQAFVRAVLPAVRPGLGVTALGEDINYWSISAADAIGIMLPAVIFALLVQRHLVGGLTFGAVKR